MSFVKEQIPNLLTAGNLMAGIVAIILTLQGRIDLAPYFILFAALLDFFDGFAARLLQVSSELGKQLDSLADIVSFGVAPGIILFQIIKIKVQAAHYLRGFVPYGVEDSYTWSNYYLDDMSYYMANELWHMPGLSKFLPLAAFVIPFFALFRLANFNIDKNQSDKFIGLPTPAATLIVVSISILIVNNYTNTAFGELSSAWLYNSYLLVLVGIITGLLMVAKIELFALKFDSFSWNKNQLRYIFLTISAILLATLFVWGLLLIVLLYIILSLINNLTNKSARDEIQS